MNFVSGGSGVLERVIAAGIACALVASCGGQTKQTGEPLATTAPLITTSVSSTTSSSSTSVVVTTLPPTTTTTTPPFPPNAKERQVAEGSSIISLRHDAAVPERLVSRLLEAVSGARAVLGDVPYVTMNAYSNADDYIAAMRLVNPRRTPENLRQLIENGLGFEVQFNSIWLYTPHLGVDPPLEVSIYHEYVHVREMALANRPLFIPQDLPWWLAEGSADYFGYKAASADGLASYARIRSERLRRVRQLPEPLSAFETTGGSAATGGSGGAYAVGLLATEYLVDTYGEEKAGRELFRSMAAGVDWKTAFNRVFGLSVAQFYDDFEAYRATL